MNLNILTLDIKIIFEEDNIPLVAMATYIYKENGIVVAKTEKLPAEMVNSLEAFLGEKFAFSI